jgi:hypothetical protein
VRLPPAKITVKDRRDEVKEGLPDDLLRRNWVTRLAEPVDDDASAGRIRVELAPAERDLVAARDSQDF